MANRMRWRYGETSPVMIVASSSVGIETGDLVFMEEGEALTTAAELSDTGTLSGNQSQFHDGFLGVAMQSSPVGDGGPIRVATSGTFEFDISPTTAELGSLIGATENSAGTALLNQTAAKVLSTANAIGRCSREELTSSPTIYVDIVSTVMRGGPQ